MVITLRYRTSHDVLAGVALRATYAILNTLAKAVYAVVDLRLFMPDRMVFRDCCIRQDATAQNDRQEKHVEFFHACSLQESGWFENNSRKSHLGM